MHDDMDLASVRSRVPEYGHEYVKGLGPRGLDAPRPYTTGPLCPMSNQGSPKALLKLQVAPKLIL
jgi:hypothetical protein